MLDSRFRGNDGAGRDPQGTSSHPRGSGTVIPAKAGNHPRFASAADATPSKSQLRSGARRSKHLCYRLPISRHDAFAITMSTT